MTTEPSHKSLGSLLSASIVVAIGALLAATFWQTCLSSKQLATNFVSPVSWYSVVAMRQQPAAMQQSPQSVAIPFWLTLLPCGVAALMTWFAGAAWLVWQRGFTWSSALVCWGKYGWAWWCLIDLWEWIWILAGAIGWESLGAFLSVTPQFWLAGCLAGWLSTLLSLRSTESVSVKSPSQAAYGRWVWLMCALYVLVFTTMNWRLYFNLLIPHGDSVMYEEHLWNLLHGKGFRSYLDQGLFLGEHIQFVHLFLLPLYILWPSHLLLEACSSTALALGAFPIFWMVRRNTGCERTAICAAVAYLLYTPMQFLDIEIDLKTFRPESFGIPLLLLTLDQLDRGSLIGTAIGALCCLTVKEDYALVFGPLGLWIACSHARDRVAPAIKLQATEYVSKTSGSVPLTALVRRDGSKWQVQRIVFGILLSIFSVVYLWLATRVVMPWFRSGVEVHYASYFAKFGKSPEEILRTMVTQPGLLFESLLTLETGLYACELLAPLAFLPLLAPGRLAVGLPLFGILCLNELEGSRNPHHQFHAPLVAIIFWALAAALPTATAIVKRTLQHFQSDGGQAEPIARAFVRNVTWTSALLTGLFFTLCPLGVAFWDPGSSWNWRKLYGPTMRSIQFAHIQNLIPRTARVASTDFVHPRFTHYARSYDYSGYKRRVSGNDNSVPDDTDYLVIDTDHRYSTIRRPQDVPELRDHPDQWTLLPDQTDGYFIVLKRNRPAAGDAVREIPVTQ